MRYKFNLTLIWLAGWEAGTVDNLLSVIEKAARIRADKKGGYAHQFKAEAKRESDRVLEKSCKGKPVGF